MSSFADDTTPFAGATPRRAAVRTIGAAGTALLGLAGLGAARVGGEQRVVGSDKRKRKRRRKRCKCNAPARIGLASAESEPFSVGAGEGVTMRASCPEGFIAISGGLEGASEVTAPCMIRESHDEPDGSAWVVNVFCTEATNTDLVVGVICFSRNSFRLQD